MWCVPRLDDEYVARMEALLRVYAKPLTEDEPVFCLDEKPVCLHAEKRRSESAWASVGSATCASLSAK